MLQRKLSHCASTAVACAVILILSLTPADASDTLVISYQGQLTDTFDSPMDAVVPMLFTIYGTPNGISAYWSEFHDSVTVTNGFFSVLLGSVSAMHRDIFDGGDRWLGISVNYDADIQPLTLITDVAEAAVSNRMVGDIKTLPGILELHPPEPCEPSDPCEPSIKLIAGLDTSSFVMHPPDPCLPPEPCGPKIDFGVGPSQAGLTVQNTFDGGENETSVKLTNGLEERGIIIIDSKPGVFGTDSTSVKMGMDTDANGIIVVDSKPGDGESGTSVKVSTGLEEKGIIIINTKPGDVGTDSTSVKMGMDTDANGIIVVDSKPGDGESGTSVKVGTGLEEKGIIIINTKPGDVGTDSTSVKMGMDVEANGIIVVDSKPGDDESGTSVKVSTAVSEKGIIVVDSKPGEVGTDSTSVKMGMDTDANGIIIIDSKPGDGESGTSVKVSTGLAEKGIIIIDSKPGGTGTDSTSVKMGMDTDQNGIIIIDSKPGEDAGGASVKMTTDLEANGIIIIDSKPAYAGGDSAAVGMQATPAQAELTLFRGSSVDEANIALRVNSTGGRVGINTNSPSEELYVVGDIVATGAITELSCLKYKTDIRKLDNALDLVDGLRGVEYKWRTEAYPELRLSEKRQIGMVAEEVETVVPELVHADANGEKSVDYSKMTAVLIEAVKELKAENEALKARIESLEQK